MKAAILAGIFVYATLFFFTTFVPSEQARQEAEAMGFTPDEIDRGLEYAFQRRLLSWTSTGTHFLLLIVLGCTSVGRNMADRCSEWAGRRWFLTLLLVALVYFV